jgi:small membrane protein
MIRILLLTALIAVGGFVTFGRNTAGLRASRKLLFLAVLMSGCLAVVFPELTQEAAELVGVGRGTDLLIYVTTVMLLTVSLVGYIDKKRSERREATMVQTVAILQAEIEDLRGRLGK